MGNAARSADRRGRPVVLVVASDTGGAQILAALLRAESAVLHAAVAAVPGSAADRLFAAAVPGAVVHDASAGAPALFDAVRPDVLLTATGLGGVELPSIREARRRGIPSVSVLDHWINYRERFGYPAPDWRLSVPDVIAVCDDDARRLAVEAGFPRVLPVQNYYLADIARRFAALPAAAERDLLVLSQVVPAGGAMNTAVHQTAAADGERRFLQEVCAQFDKLAGFLNIDRVVVRLHPAQPETLYDELPAAFPQVPWSIVPAASCDLVEQLRTARIAVGCSSMALFTATALGRETCSFPGAEGLPTAGRYRIAGVQDILDRTWTPSAGARGTVYTGEDTRIIHILAALDA